MFMVMIRRILPYRITGKQVIYIDNLGFLVTQVVPMLTKGYAT